MATVSTAHPDAIFEVTTVVGGGSAAVALVDLAAERVVSVVAALEREDAVTDLDILWTDEAGALLQVESTDRSLLRPVSRAGVPLSTPFTVRDGTATWVVQTTSARLSALGDALDEAGVSYAVEYVGGVVDGVAAEVLTARQREVLTVAIEMGYYETPRRATLTEVADALSVSKATASDVLHRAEGHVVHRFADEHLGGGG